MRCRKFVSFVVVIIIIIISLENNYVVVTMQDVAVKVLTVQDFHDDQLREFLREVGICLSLMSSSDMLDVSFSSMQL